MLLAPVGQVESSTGHCVLLIMVQLQKDAATVLLGFA